MNYLEKPYHKSYLNSAVVLCLDLAVSALSSLFAISLAKLFFSPSGISAITAIWWLSGSILFSCFFFIVFKTHKAIIRHSTIHSMSKLTVAVICKFIALAALLYVVPSIEMSSRLWVELILDMLISFALLMIMRIAMIIAYNFVREHYGRQNNIERILIYGTGDKSISVITRLATSPHYKVVDFLCYGNKLKDYKISEYSVLSFKDLNSLEKIKENYRIDGVLFAIEDDARTEQERLIKYCTECKLKVLIAPSIDEVIDGKVMKQNIREIKIEDLLGRDEIKINLKEIQENFAGKVVMVTGAAGSIGAELCRQLAGFGVRQLILFDNAETPMHNIRLELEERYPELDFVSVIGDVRFLARLDYGVQKMASTGCIPRRCI